MDTAYSAMDTNNVHLYAYFKSDYYCSHKETKQHIWAGTWVWWTGQPVCMSC